MSNCQKTPKRNVKINQLIDTTFKICADKQKCNIQTWTKMIRIVGTIYWLFCNPLPRWDRHSSVNENIFHSTFFYFFITRRYQKKCLLYNIRFLMENSTFNPKPRTICVQILKNQNKTYHCNLVQLMKECTKNM